MLHVILRASCQYSPLFLNIQETNFYGKSPHVSPRMHQCVSSVTMLSAHMSFWYTHAAFPFQHLIILSSHCHCIDKILYGSDTLVQEK